VKEGGSAGSIVELRGDFEEALDRNIALHGVLVRPNRPTLDRLADAVERRVLRPIVDAIVEPTSIVGSTPPRREWSWDKGGSSCA